MSICTRFGASYAQSTLFGLENTNLPLETSGCASRAISFSCLKSACIVCVFFCCTCTCLMTDSSVTAGADFDAAASGITTMTAQTAVARMFDLDMASEERVERVDHS